MIEEYDFTNFWDDINRQFEEQHLVEIIERYDFIVGSAEVKDQLEHILPDGANIVCSKYLESPTAILAIKKFDISDLIKI